MRKGHSQHQQHHHHLQHIGTFLPVLCSKPSMIKDVHIPNPFSKDHYSSGRGMEDPSLSPKVGCMGQVRKKDQLHHDNYRLGMVFPTTITSTTSSYTTTNNNNPNTEAGHVSSNFSYSKLLRLFSSKTLLTTPSVVSSGATKNKKTSFSCRKEPNSVGVSHSRLRSRSCEDGAVIGFGSPINVADLDPPLPVVIKKKTSAPSVVDGQISEGENNKNSSLWKRRSGGAALKGLQIQQVHIPIQSTTSSV